MSVETRDQLEFQRYLEYQRTQRQSRVETLGGAATMLVLSTIDLGLSEVHDPITESRRPRHAEADYAGELAEVIPLRATRERRLAHFAAESAELGYAKAA